MDSPLRTGLRHQGLSPWLNLWADALDRYKERTGINLWNATDELSQRLYTATEENDAIEILEERLDTFNSFREGSPTKENTRKGLKAVVRAVLLFSDAIAEGVSVVPGAKSILVAVGVFLKATQEVSNRFDIVGELFERLGHFLRRLQAREGVPHSEGSRAITVQIFVELLNIFALTTKAMKQKRLTHYAHALLKKDKIRESLHTLDFLTSQELSMNVVENLGVTHQVLRMQRDFQYDFHLAMQEHNRNITSRSDQLLAQMDAIRRFADFLYEGLRSIRISRQRALESPTSASVTTLPVHSGEARSEHMHEIIIQALEAAFRGDRHATLFCFILFAAGYLNLGSSIHINVSTTQFVFLLLALWKSLFWIQRSIPASVKYNRSNLVTFVDLLGTQIHLSMELCLTSDTLHKILRAHFEDKKCRWFVENRRYELTKSDSDFAITQETWKSVVICGAEIMMNAILSKQSSQPIQSVICPSCETDSTEHSSELAAWVTCRTCYHQFKMSHARSGAPLVSSQNAQTSTRLDGSASVHPSTQFGASTNDRPDAPVIPPTIYLEPLSPMPVDDLKYCRRTRIDTVLENSTLNNGNNSRLHATTVPRWRSVDSALSDPSSDSSGSWMDLVSRSWLSHPPFGFSLHQLLDGEIGSEHLIADLSAYILSLRHQGRPVSQIDCQSPATVPVLRSVRIVCDLIPQWPIDITLDGTSITPFRPNRAAIDYITVEDILCSIHSDLHRQITHRDWNELAPAQEIEVARAYTRRYGADLQREKEIRSAGVKRIDFLGECVFFRGLTQLAPEDGIERLQLIVDHRDEASRDS